ncbi:YolD-like family protein [Sporosarcina sp. NPDC096371]|uniref:YolD-like family protein n=1 Tax=Sporosarcina sp. NPDC096371 TaxID=3364530 RepID=UPI0037F124F4
MLENLQDRGNIKWRGLMLPEHVAKINDWKAKNKYIERPQLDDWELEAKQMELELAYKRQSDAMVTMWKNGKMIMYNGKISELDYTRGIISVDSPYGHDRVPVADVIKVDSVY